MKAVKVLFALSVLSSFYCRQVTPVLQAAVEVVSFGIDVYSFFDSILGEDEDKSPPPPIEYDRIINRISEKIEASTDTVVFKIELQSYISELRDVALTVKQLLAEMMDIVTAKSKEKREEYQRRFRGNYRQHQTKLYRIKNLLAFKIDVSGISNTLLALIANEFECGMTKLEEFQNYYMTLVSDVVALSLLNERLEEKSLYNDTLASWKTATRSLYTDFEKQKSNCKAKFFGLIKKNFDKINDPSQLYQSNQNRYPYKATDVLFLSGSYCVWNLKNYNNILKKMHERTFTYVVINENKNEAAHSREQYLKITSTTQFRDCLEDTGKIISYFDVLGEDLIFWLMFPQDISDKFRILLDQNSTASQINHVQDGTEYTTILYVRAQDIEVNSTLTLADFDTVFNEDTVEEPSGLKTWQFWAIIGGSALVLIITITIIVAKIYKKCRESRFDY
ncbi:uncharacterized protein LOC132742517 [Ruditapes philippinarum]|uniref:uncharacterized protein LOC132742517 n=1 Tax=Ruditapes philippinarum TaxID=129788 RepID=UPI00295BA46A|nr:uncharacterized protein LOC132742517 [Ruditapes philippinarum]